jgi:chorismate mutase
MNTDAPLDRPAHEAADSAPGGDTGGASGRLDLAELRAELDAIDDGLHDLLMRRAAAVARLAASGVKGGVALRPGREASIIRRLLARNAGPLPPQAVVRLWRELLAASTALQGPYAIAVCDAEAGSGYTAAAREHFGALTALRVHGSPAQALADVSAGSAAAAVLPEPSEGEAPRDAWWTALLQKDEPRIHVVARLPFWRPRPEGAPRARAFVIAASAPDPSGRDRSLIGFDLDAGISRDRLTAALAAAGLPPEQTILRRDEDGRDGRVLADVAGFVTDDDPRLAAAAPLLRRPVVLGAYALPEGS